MANDFNDLCDVGISYPQATEIGRQMAAGTGNPNLLCATGMNAGPAIELARQIGVGSFSAVQLVAAMWNPTVAVELAFLGVISPALFTNGQLATSGFHWEFLFDDLTGQRVTDDVTGQPVVDLVKG